MDLLNKIGIGITTRNRNELIKQCVSNIIKFTCFDKLIVVDDASEIPVSIDGIEVYRFNTQQGIARGKNKCIEYLDDCEHIFLFDDDCWPIKEGWENTYIQYAKESGCNHFSYTWTVNNKIGYHRIIDNFICRKFHLKIEGQPEEINDIAVHNTQVRIRNVREGRPASHPYTQEEVIHYDINSHLNPHGVMLYISNICIQTVGGFDTEYGLYGGEHGDFTNRIYNAKLNPLGKNLDINNSDQYFYALDRETKQKSTIDTKYKMDNDKRITSLLKANKDSIEFKNYKDENNSTQR